MPWGGLLCGWRGAPEGCAIALPRGCAGGGVPRGCRCWKPPHALGGPLCGRRGSPEGCAGGGVLEPCRGCTTALPRPLLETAACLGRPPMSAEGCAGGVGRRGVLEPCRGVRHSPADGGAMTLPRGCASGGRHSPAEGVCRRGVAVGSRRMPWGVSYVGGGERQRGVP